MMTTGILEPGADGWLLDGAAWEPDGTFYAVLGDPIAHSLSPRMQEAALTEREIDAQYLPIRITAGQLRRLKETELGHQLAGFNVTAPLKEAVAALCDGRTDAARDLGAVNAVRVEEGRWLGHNTDSGAILTVLSEGWTGAEPPTRGVVLGAGGSARAAVDALLRMELTTIEVRNRSARRLDQLGQWLAGRGLTEQVELRPLTAEEPGVGAEPTLWICCLAGGVDAMPYLPDTGSPEATFLLDLRYGDQLSGHLAPLGFGASDGLPVLLMQGGLSFAWWFGPPVPWRSMREALA